MISVSCWDVLTALHLISHVDVPPTGHDGRRSGGKPQLFESKGRSRLLPFQLMVRGDEEDKRSPWL